MFSVIVVVLFGTWMSQEASNWLVNGLQPTYKWGTLWLYSTYKPFTNFLKNPSIAMYPRLCNYVVQFAILYFIAKATQANLCSKRPLKKPTRTWAKEMSSRDFNVVNMLMIFLFLDILLSIYIYIFIYITYIFHQKQPGGPPFFLMSLWGFLMPRQHITTCTFSEGLRWFLGLWTKTLLGRIEMCTIPINVSCF